MTPPLPSPQSLPDEIQHSALLQLLSNTLILCHISPNLGVTDLLALAATSRAFRYLIYETPQVFRYLDLRPVKSARFDIAGIDHGGETWRNVQLDENLTEDDFYSGPLRGIFSNLRRANILSDVQVLMLDGLAVTADLVHEILTDPSYSVRILSLRECKHLNSKQLRGALQYACRGSRPKGTPTLKGLYVFGKADVQSSDPAAAKEALPSSESEPGSSSSPSSSSEKEPWYGQRGWQFPGTDHIKEDWAQTLVDCDGVIAFDAVLCKGPRHLNSPAWGKVDVAALDAASSFTGHAVPQWNVAQFSLGGCAGCGSAPEGWTVWGEEAAASESTRSGDGGGIGDADPSRANPDIGRFPLLPRPPRHSSSVKAAMCPAGQPVMCQGRTMSGDDAQTTARFIPRCGACLRDRYCTSCQRWWCELCYVGPWAAPATGSQGVDRVTQLPNANSATGTARKPNEKPRVTRSCWECGMNCHDCIDGTQRTCGICGGGYCIIHNEGSNLSHCDWCSTRGRRIRELY